MGLYLGTQNLLEGIGSVDGTGTPNYLTKWNDADTIEDSILSDDGNTATVSGALTVTGVATLNTSLTGLLRADSGIVSIGTAASSSTINPTDNSIPVRSDATTFIDSPITVASISRAGTGAFENVNVFNFLTSNSTTLHLSTNAAVLSSAIVGEFYELQGDSTRFIEVTAVGGSAITFSGTFSSDEFFNNIVLALRATTVPSSTATVGSDLTVTGTTTIDSAITGLLRADAGVVSDSGVPITAATGTSTVINATLSAGKTIGSTEVTVNGTDAPAIQAILDAGGTVSFTFSNNIETPLVIGSAAAIDGGTYRLSGLVPGLQASYAVNTAIVITSIPVLTTIEGNLAVTGNLGSLKVKDSVEATTANTNLKLKGAGTGGVEVMGDTTSATDGSIQLNCYVNSHGVTIQSPPHSDSATYTLILPSTVGTADQVLTSGGAGTGAQLTWSTPTSGGITPNYVTSAIQMIASNLYILGDIANAHILTLPASPNLGDTITISNRSALTTNVIAANGNNIMGASTDLTIDISNAAFELIWTAGTQGWVVIGNV